MDLPRWPEQEKRAFSAHHPIRELVSGTGLHAHQIRCQQRCAIPR